MALLSQAWPLQSMALVSQAGLHRALLYQAKLASTEHGYTKPILASTEHGYTKPILASIEHGFTKPSWPPQSMALLNQAGLHRAWLY